MALDTGKAKDSLFGNIKKAKEEAPKESEITPEASHHPVNGTAIIAEIPTKKINGEGKSNLLAKWQQFDKVTALLTGDQKEGLDRVAKKLMKFRSKQLKGNEDKERITANTLIRALIENFLKYEDSLQLEILSSEADVQEWIKKALKDN